ncbi:MAG: phage tail sheath C-terminal domain-containing protein [Minicystis sp.]
MPVTPTYPGVYVEEVPSAVRTITGVGTSIALFIGRAAQGSLEKPTLCLSYADFARAYGEDTRFGELPQSVRLFFDNGGSQCWVLRVASGAQAASVKLKSEGGTEVLQLTAKSAGVFGRTIRAAVTYSGPRPEATFNIEIFRWVKDPSSPDTLVPGDRELWTNLSMDPTSRRYAPDFITQASKLVDAKLPGPLTAGNGYSQSGRPLDLPSAGDDTAFNDAWKNARGTGTDFRISVGGSDPVKVDLSGVPTITGMTPTERVNNLAGEIERIINPLLPAGKAVTVSFVAGPKNTAGKDTSLLRIASNKADVLILPAADTTKDLTTALMLGEPQGGLEVAAWADARPAPSGITYKALTALTTFAETGQDKIDQITIDGQKVGVGPVNTAGAKPIYVDGYASSKNGHSDGVREKLGIIVSSFNTNAAAAGVRWRAELWGLRLALIPTDGSDNVVPTIGTALAAGGGTDLKAGFNTNVRYASLGAGGVGLQTPGAAGDDGDAPNDAAYKAAYAIVDKEIDLFNLLILPENKDKNGDPVARNTLWGPASVFCQARRALLLVDPPEEWTSTKPATDPSIGADVLRRGLAKTNAAVFYPRLVINDGGLNVTLSPSGAIAGLMARIDSSRGVWKAPAGMEADLRSVIGLEERFSDNENGVLNQRAVNTLRVFPFGIVNWGARTLDGYDGSGSEWKYVPVRRLALYLEESLYRGIQWAVFEPNDEPLWAQLRLNVGAFLQSLFRQGAFQGRSPREAYFVKCDRDTTTQDDINRGIVNVVVGFAPLKPAEFVIIKIQQMAGQLTA